VGEGELASGGIVRWRGVRDRVTQSLSQSAPRCRLASTIHSAQGLTLWFGVIIGDLFGHNAALGARRRAVTRQALYVALSRARQLKDVFLLTKLTMADINRCKPSANDLKYVAKIHEAARKTAQVFQLWE